MKRALTLGVALGFLFPISSSYAGAPESLLNPGAYRDGHGHCFELKEGTDGFLFLPHHLLGVGKREDRWIQLRPRSAKDGTKIWLARLNREYDGITSRYWAHIDFEFREKNGNIFLSQASGREIWPYNKTSYPYDSPFTRAKEGETCDEPEKLDPLPPDDSPLNYLPDTTSVSDLHAMTVIIPTRDILFPAKGYIEATKIADLGRKPAYNYNGYLDITFGYSYKLAFLNPRKSFRPHWLRKGRRLWVTKNESESLELRTNAGQRFSLSYSAGSSSEAHHTLRWLNAAADGLFWFGELTPEEIPE